MAPETLMERSYDLKRVRAPRTGHRRAEKRVLSRVRPARQRETVKASIPSRAQLKGSTRLLPGMLP